MDLLNKLWYWLRSHLDPSEIWTEEEYHRDNQDLYWKKNKELDAYEPKGWEQFPKITKIN